MNLIPIPPGLETESFVLEAGAMRHTPEILRKHWGAAPNVWLVADENTWRAAGEKLDAILRAAGITCCEPYLFPGTPTLHATTGHVDELLAAVKLVHGSASSGERPTVCFTGKMPEKRSYYEKLAEAHGYAPADDVTSHLSVLVAADVNDTSSKLKKAAKLGIRVVPLDEFLNELNPAAAPATPPGAPAAPAARELPDGQLELGL